MRSKFSFRYITPPVNIGQVPFRVLSTLIVPVLARTPVTPNQVTLVRTGVVLGALYLFATGEPVNLLYGVGLFYIFEILDHVDGDLARYTGRLTRTGPLLEQFVDTWASRPSNLLGLAFAVGMYNLTSDTVGFVLLGLTVFGRLMWLEYRDYFGWVRDRREKIVGIQGNSLGSALQGTFAVLYTWNNTFLLWGALLYTPVESNLSLDSLVVGFIIVAILNNIPWIAILVRGFSGVHRTSSN